MNERDLETRLRHAFRAEAGDADPGALSERVHSIPATVEPRRRRWWHGPMFGASRGIEPGGIKVRGARNMMAATGVTAVVAALALGASFLAFQTGGPTTDLSPGATSSGEWITVTGTQQIDSAVGSSLYGHHVDMSDPRLEGAVSIRFEWNGPLDEDAVAGSTLWSTIDVTNADGSWHGQSVGFVDETGAHRHMDWLKGGGDYEGLVFIGQLSEQDSFEGEGGGLVLDVVGLIYEGELPPMVLPSWSPE